jgi:hypothetical protein
LHCSLFSMRSCVYPRKKTGTGALFFSDTHQNTYPCIRIQKEETKKSQKFAR